jgi:hypothetical protein
MRLGPYGDGYVRRAGCDGDRAPAGTAFGIPTTQAIRSYKGWKAWDEGEAPATAILFGPLQKD